VISPTLLAGGKLGADLFDLPMLLLDGDTEDADRRFCFFGGDGPHDDRFLPFLFP